MKDVKGIILNSD